MRRRSIVAVSVLWLALAVGVADARVVEPGDLDPGLLKLQVSLDKAAYQAGEPITADVAITNLSKGTIRVEDFEDFTGRMDGFQVKALTNDGKEIPPGRYFLFREAIGRSVAVQPAETYRRTFVANYQAPVREPGSTRSR